MAYISTMGIEHLDFEPGDPDEELPEDADAAPEVPRHGLNTADTQNSIVPHGWKPSQAAPVPVVRCVTIKKDGTRCKRWSIRGYTKCKSHAGPGALMPDGNVNKYAASIIEAARLRLIDSADDALEVLLQLSQPGTGEAIRLKAATEVLDRAGIRGGFEVEITGEVTVSSADEIRKRLTELRKGSEELSRMQGEIVEGEIIEDDGQDALFEFDTPETPKDEA